MQIAPLGPIGVGSRDVESLTSYIRRLARCQRLPVTSFLRATVLEPVRRERAQRDLAIQPSRATESVNGTGGVPEMLVQRLERLSGRSDLIALTLIGRDGGVCLREALRTSRAWCARCLAMDDLPAYDRLSWTFREFRACDTHEIPLTRSCGHCGSLQPPLAEWAHAFRCHVCGHLLARARPEQVTGPEWARSRALTVLVPTLLSQALSREQVMADISAAVLRAGSLRALGRQSGVSTAELSALRRGLVRPHLSAYLSVVTGIPSEDMRTARPRAPTSPDRVREALTLALHRRPVPSVRAVAKEVAMAPATLRSRWPALTATLLSARSAERGAGAQERQRQRLEAIRAAVTAALDKRGVRRRAVEHHLSQPGLLRSPWARRTLRALLAERRIDPLCQRRSELAYAREGGVHHGNPRSR